MSVDQSSPEPAAAGAPVADRFARVNVVLGCCLALTMVFTLWVEWGGGRIPNLIADVFTVAALAILTVEVGWSRRVFVVIGAALLAAVMLVRGDWDAVLYDALRSAAFIAAFFTALATLRHAASSSVAVERCGRFLANQPPGRRYVALTTGGHLFGLILGYGSISLLGGLAEASARGETNEEIRRIRLQRMLLAIQRGFVATLPWSPLAFAMAVSTSLVPGASWTGAVGGCLVTAAIMAGLGWALDASFKPKLSGPRPPRAAPQGDWGLVLPLVLLLALLVISIGALQAASGVRMVGVAMLVAPAIAFGWIALQTRHRGAVLQTASRARYYLTRELPEYRSELVVLMMAGFIGTVGARLLGPLFEVSGVDLAALPAWAILLSLVWLIPLAGQAGMNPILFVSLAAPLLPEAAELGITPDAIIVAITAGWALGGASSPFTATTMLVSASAGVSATEVGIRWNGAYTLIAGGVLSAWVIAYAQL